MSLRQHKGKLATGAVITVLMLAVVFWPSTTSVRVTFLYTTNNPKGGPVGVFEVVNHLNESVMIVAGHFHPVERSGLYGEAEGDGVLPVAPLALEYAAGTTNALQFPSPTNGRPYKLVLQCLPTSKATLKFVMPRLRIVNFISPWVHPTSEMQARWCGRIFVESRPFETAPR